MSSHKKSATLMLRGISVPYALRTNSVRSLQAATSRERDAAARNRRRRSHRDPRRNGWTRPPASRNSGDGFTQMRNGPPSSVADERLVGNQRKTRTVRRQRAGHTDWPILKACIQPSGGDPTVARGTQRTRARQTARGNGSARRGTDRAEAEAQGVARSVTISATPASASTFACCSAADARLALLATRAEGDRPWARALPALKASTQAASTNKSRDEAADGRRAVRRASPKAHLKKHKCSWRRLRAGYSSSIATSPRRSGSRSARRKTTHDARTRL